MNKIAAVLAISLPFFCFKLKNFPSWIRILDPACNTFHFFLTSYLHIVRAVEVLSAKCMYQTLWLGTAILFLVLEWNMQHFIKRWEAPHHPVNSDECTLCRSLDFSTAKRKNWKKDDQCIFSAKMHARAQLSLVS